METNFVINDFEGPLDLLLHLIKTNKMDIYDISISKITEEYLDFINKMEEMNLTVASSYLVMASELLEIKSKMLLPSYDDEEEEDPREDLVNRLVEYQKYKESLEKPAEEVQKPTKPRAPRKTMPTAKTTENKPKTKKTTTTRKKTDKSEDNK